MKEILKRGATSNILRVFLPDSASTTGAGKTGLTNTSSGLIISTIADVEASATTYTSAASNVETITTLGTFAAPSSGKARFKEVDATNFPGLYEIQIADARFDVTVSSRQATALVISVQCTGVAPTFAEIQLVAVDLYDSVRMGMTALPNAAAALSGGLATLSADQSSNGTIPVDVVKISGDATAADNLEAATDGTGFNVGNGQIQALSVTNAVTVGTINSDVITASAIATDAAQELADTFWQADNDTKYSTGQWDSDSFGRTVLRSSNTQAEVDVNGNNHVSAVVHQMQTDVITAAALATDAVTEIAQGVLSEATSTNPATYAVGDVGNVLGRLVNMIEADGVDFRYTANALEQAPSGGGGGGGGWELNEDQTTGLKRMITAIVGVGGETATPGVLEFDMIGETTTLRITQSTDGNDRLTVEEV